MATTFAAFARAAEAIGAADFHARLLGALQTLAPWDAADAVRYSTHAAPEFLHTEGLTDAVTEIYNSGFYRFDPFYHWWREEGGEAIVTLGSFKGRRDRTGEYFTGFLPRLGILDELGLFLPSADDEVIALFLENRTRQYQARDIARIEPARPLFAALHRAHSARTKAGARPRGTAPALPPLDFEAAYQAFATGRMTRRETQIARLILTGYPTEAIAKALGIGRGTVKNHRRRLYDKLDITTERELFSLFLEHLAHPRRA